MGSGNVSRAVADAGPLIHLSEIGQLPLLSVFDVLDIPDAVWRETVEAGRILESDLLSLGIVQQHTLRRWAVTRFARQKKLETLHEGERACLYLCQREHVPILLTDDLAVREAAQRLAVTPVGSLGLVARAYRVGRLSLADATHCLDDLYDISSLFVTRAIVDLAIEQLQRVPPGSS